MNSPHIFQQEIIHDGDYAGDTKSGNFKWGVNGITQSHYRDVEGVKS
ncbi:hypothetical protein [Algoriphagus boritolerans]